MNTQIFEDFENIIQRERSFIINQYGVRAYNICCSVRDWFETCLNHIHPLFEDKNYCPIGLNLYMDIIVADIFQGGAKKLFWNFLMEADYENKSATHFFKNRKEASDDEHLKEIRAIFGAHPFEIGRVKKNNDRSSLGCVHYLGDSPRWLGNPAAIVSRATGKTESFSLSLDELKQFIVHRFSLLAVITEKIKSDIANFVEEMKAHPIGITNEMSPLEKLNVLYDEAGENKRGKVGIEFQNEVEKLRSIFSCKITSPKNRVMVETYRKALLPIIEKYRETLQNMTFLDSWSDEPLLDAVNLGLPPQNRIDIRDLLIESSKSQIGESCLEKLFSSKFETAHSSCKEFYLLICAYLYSVHKEKA